MPSEQTIHCESYHDFEWVFAGGEAGSAKYNFTESCILEQIIHIHIRDQ